LEDLILEQEAQMEKYKEKSREQNQKCKLLQEELSTVYSSGD